MAERRAKDMAAGVLRDAEWLNPGRVRAWMRLLAIGMCGWGGAMLLAQLTGGHWGGLGGDFPCFYAAGAMAHHGQAALVYVPASMARAEQALTGAAGTDGYLPFFYPPPFLLLCWALAFLPYWAAFTVFIAAGLAPLVIAMRRMLPLGWRVLPLLAFPGLWITMLSGQNGLIFAACLAWFMVLADRRPGLSGMWLGVLVCKPHLAIGVPFALAAAGRWRSLAACAGAAAALSVASWAVLGTGPWVAFAHSAHAASTAVTGGMIMQSRIQSAFMAARLLGAGLGVAAVVQAAVTLATLAVLVGFARRRPSGAALGAAMAASALLLTPYVLDYDLVCMAPALAFAAVRRDVAYARVAVLLGFVLPLISSVVATDLRVQIAPVVVFALLVVMARGRVAVQERQFA
jgi:hypothetical protein